MKREHVDIDGRHRSVPRFVQDEPLVATSTLRGVALTRMLHENATHHLRCEREKVTPVLPLDALLIE